MIDVRYHKCIQIVVTQRCPHRCSNCSQLIGHHKNPFVMTLDQIENALQTLVDYPGHIGMFGGEPTTHPQFPEICELYRKYVPVKARRELWTAGFAWDKYKDIIHDTFYPEQIAYNEHWEYQPCFHQPLQVGIGEVVEDSITRDRIVQNCWVQLRWSSAITPKGAFFCEVAAARTHIFDWDIGIPVKKGWWKRPIGDFQSQISRCCKKCSACIPMPMIPNDKQEWDDVSPKVYKHLKEAGSPKLKKGKCKVFDIESLKEYLTGHNFKPENENYRLRGGFKDFPDWHPWNYRSFDDKAHGPHEENKDGQSKHHNSDTKQGKAADRQGC